MAKAAEVNMEAVMDELYKRAKALSYVSDEMTVVVSEFESRLAKLGIGLSVWVTVAETSDGAREIGYVKREGRWGVHIRQLHGERGAPDFQEEVWQFASAPRWLRIEASCKMSDILVALVSRCEEATGTIQNRIRDIKALNAVIASTEGT